MTLRERLTVRYSGLPVTHWTTSAAVVLVVPLWATLESAWDQNTTMKLKLLTYLLLITVLIVTVLLVRPIGSKLGFSGEAPAVVASFWLGWMLWFLLIVAVQILKDAGVSTISASDSTSSTVVQIAKFAGLCCVLVIGWLEFVRWRQRRPRATTSS